MLKYTIAFIKRGNEILLLNREASSWMGSWNGVGGKLEEDESPTECILREIREETGIILQDVTFKGTVTWNVDSKYHNGMYAFIAEVPDSYEYFTPIKTDEGILDWKKIDWILHPENTGVANLHYFLREMIQENHAYDYHFVYKDKRVEHFVQRKLVDLVDS
ncbi:NUDIX hydrolase [Paucisalibacillus globulus]|uniref:NUDIX hydrolase n=1 Tax=Paucisalibacillus globulus TaxID=351095 RepID=UPI0003F6B34F|nr:8-oxo-dGTP diphosphatase [Paucisalibacillus globulus]